jgi:hypothetical protein
MTASIPVAGRQRFPASISIMAHRLQTPVRAVQGAQDNSCKITGSQSGNWFAVAKKSIGLALPALFAVTRG